MPRLSVITVNLNNKKGLERTTASVVSQSFSDFEFIVIDGGSTDGSVETIRKHSTRIQYWVSEGDQGIYTAMNKGILKGNGEYCFFLNSGDYFCSDDTLEKVFNRQIGSDVVFGNLLVYEDGRFLGRSKGRPEPTFLDIYSSTIKHQAAFIRRDLFQKYGLYDESLKIVADWAFFLKTVGLNGATVQYVDVDISCFSTGGLSYSDPDRCRTERQRVLDEYLPDLIQRDYLLLEKYRGIRWLDRSRLGWLLFRLLAKPFKIYYHNREVQNRQTILHRTRNSRVLNTEDSHLI